MIEIKLSTHHVNPAWQWCIDNLGRPEPNGKLWAWDSIRTFWFHREEDASMFALRWS